MKGAQKLLLAVTLLVLVFGFLPLLAQPLPYKELDWLSYEATMYYGDAYEPDDSRNLAKPIQVNGAVQMRNFHVRRDQDWVWFYAQQGTSYVVETRARPIGSLADTVLELYDNTGQLLASDDDGWKDWIYPSPDGKWISYNAEDYVKTRPEGTIWEVDVEELLKGVKKQQKK